MTIFSITILTMFESSVMSVKPSLMMAVSYMFQALLNLSPWSTRLHSSCVCKTYLRNVYLVVNKHINKELIGLSNDACFNHFVEQALNEASGCIIDGIIVLSTCKPLLNGCDGTV